MSLKRHREAKEIFFVSSCRGATLPVCIIFLLECYINIKQCFTEITGLCYVLHERRKGGR